MMKTLPNNSKAVIGAAMLAVLFVAGCERRAAETPASTDSTTTSPAPTTPPENTAPAAPSATVPENPVPPSEAGKSAGAVIDDTVVTTKVKTALLADSDIKGLDVNVDTAQGVVTLNGAVNNQTQIDRAAKIAGEVEGVKSVVNNLSIKK
ncbi:MAG TPA: BON domain-containing protein [Oxalicibacterium sp.]|uniref:BON domain-containing protein n=1 Tax=Oxalicibacterium sp. TaxID=2766525 RepID=UPI002D19E6C2|nr:BON domain-containing protein [Oxalicibacterium sp.]HWU97462.1 BON domain-containing protein [Oxalicibacterium sp.]